MQQRIEAFLWSEEADLAPSACSQSKRLVDAAGAALLLVLFLPLFAAVALLIKLTSRGPVLFVQRRIGYQCNEFPMLKFRTMIDGAHRLEAELKERTPGRTFFKLVDDPRTTRLGRLLRRTSLDELPQLYNVLVGDMSLVGPRPLLVSDFCKFPGGEQMRRFAARPGLTGLWQVSGRSRLSDERRMALDVEYVARWSPALDLEILARTLPAVLRGDGAH